MLSGINMEATVKLAQALTIPVIASGGLSNIADIERLCAVEDQGVTGVTQLDEVDALDDPPAGHVEAGNDSLGEHQAAPISSARVCAAAKSRSPL